MKVGLNWIKKLTDIDLSVDELVEKIGAQLGAVEEVVNLGERYQGIVVAKVVDCQKHHDADKLSVCVVDDGGKVKGVDRNAQGLVQVVCGAPNVAAGQLVAWIPPGATVPATLDKDPFVLEAKELRGVISNGMIASAHELALGDNHDGILVLSDVKPGEDFAKALELDDFIIDIENKMFTHRPDCFGILGIAREVAGIQGKPFKSPDWYSSSPPIKGGDGLSLEVKNEIPELVPRFCAIAMDDVVVGPSPAKFQSNLARLGIRPINNVVDATNFIMLLTGQPVHAYDYDKLKTSKLGVRLAKDGEILNLIGGKQQKLQAGAIVITDGERPVGLGGVMGGADTEVDEHTTRIVLEAATFDMNLTRKTAMTYGLFTDAATRFTKGQSPLQNLAALHELTIRLQKLAGAKVASGLVDEKAPAPVAKPVVVVSDFVNARLGEKLSPSDMKRLLENVEFDVSTEQGELIVKAPFWRTDIEIPEDIVEEVGRLHGYDKLPKDLPTRSIKATPINAELAFKTQLREILLAAGANELLTYSFVNEKLLLAAGQDPAQSFHIKNALSPDLQYYRQSLTPSLLDKVHGNIKSGFSEFAIYEIGKAHNKQHASSGDEKVPQEFDVLALVVAADDKVAKNRAGSAFYQARAYLDFIANRLGLELEYKPYPGGDYPVTKPFEPSRTALASVKGTNITVGGVGEFRASVTRQLKLPRWCAGFEIGLEQLIQVASGQGSQYAPLNRYPQTEQDICLRAPATTAYQVLSDFIESQLAEAAAANGYAYNVRPLDIYQKDGDDHTQTTWRISLWHPEKTLKTEEVNKLLDDLANKAKKLGAERI